MANSEIKVSLVQLAPAVLYGVAAFGVFLTLLDRVLIFMSNNKAKAFAILGFSSVLVGGSLVAGFFLFRPPWVYVPVALLDLIFIGEGRQVLIRSRRCPC